MILVVPMNVVTTIEINMMFIQVDFKNLEILEFGEIIWGLM